MNGFKGFAEYPNIAAVCNAAATNGSTEADKEWAGGTREDAIAYAEKGDLKSVGEVENQMARIIAPLADSGMIQSWERAPVGAFPSVPDFLAGQPANMWHKQPIVDEHAEVSVFIPHGGHCNLSAQELAGYGATVAALLLALSQQYTVRARVYLPATKSKGTIFDLSTPYDVSEICAVFCQPCTYRQGTIREALPRAEAVGDWGIMIPDWARDSDKMRLRKNLTKYGANEKSVIINSVDCTAICKLSTNEARAEYINKIISAVKD